MSGRRECRNCGFMTRRRKAGLCVACCNASAVAVLAPIGLAILGVDARGDQ